MKLKYYLRGVGIGIIFATLVMTVSSLVHKYNLSDEYIIKEARKLGMVMQDELSESEDLWSSDDTEDTEDTESLPVSGSEVDSSQLENTSESESESESQATAPSEEPVTSESESQSQAQAYATITIERGDYARQVGEKLFAAGILKSAEEAEAFRIYMGEHGYAKSIHAGTYNIPVGATYEEICKIVAG